MTEKIFPIDVESRKLFDSKGMKGNKCDPENVNGYKVRRVMQLIKDYSNEPFNELRILDLACGEGVYAIEAALHGAEVTAIDARTERMYEGVNAAERLGLSNIHFYKQDIREIDVDLHGPTDVVLLLGILYHLDKDDIYKVLENIYEICREFVIIDTHISLHGENRVQYGSGLYYGEPYQEHNVHDPEEVRRQKLLASIDNPVSFWFKKESLLRLLRNIGFTSVCECMVPQEPNKPENRITLVAMKGEPVGISTYPWVNER